jgi:hypothetical protein
MPSNKAAVAEGDRSDEETSTIRLDMSHQREDQQYHENQA